MFVLSPLKTGLKMKKILRHTGNVSSLTGDDFGLVDTFWLFTPEMSHFHKFQQLLHS